MTKPEIEDVVALTKRLVHQYAKGNFDEWFDHLALNSVFVATGEGMLVGASNIQYYLQKYSDRAKGIIYKEEYSHIPLNKKVAIVTVEVVMGQESNESFRISNWFTFVYQLIGSKTRIVYEHASYEYFNQNHPIDEQPLSMDMYTFQFVKHLLMDQPAQDHLCIANGNQTLFVDMNTIIYIQSKKHHTLLHCIDKSITCFKPIGELKKELNHDFYQIHRSYIINTRYLTSLSCYEAELISGIVIPIPAVSYGKVKTELENKLRRPLKKNKKNVTGK